MGHLWDFLVHPQTSYSILSWAVPVLRQRIQQHGTASCWLEKKKNQTVKHQGGDNAELQRGRARGQSHDEKWPGTNAFGLKKNKFSYLLNSGERPIVLGSLPAPLRSLELRTFTKYKELLIVFCLVGTYMINSMQALLVQ